MTENRKRELLLALVPALCDERGMEAGLGEDATTDELFSAFRALNLYTKKSRKIVHFLPIFPT